MQRPLKIGDLLHCPHRRRWHPAVKWHTEGTDYTLRMLFFAAFRWFVPFTNHASWLNRIELWVILPLTNPRNPLWLPSQPSEINCRE
jgi:hypothetical protein